MNWLTVFKNDDRLSSTADSASFCECIIFLTVLAVFSCVQ